jgi:hypothetical protein
MSGNRIKELMGKFTVRKNWDLSWKLEFGTWN